MNTIVVYVSVALCAALFLRVLFLAGQRTDLTKTIKTVRQHFEFEKLASAALEKVRVGLIERNADGERRLRTACAERDKLQWQVSEMQTLICGQFRGIAATLGFPSIHPVDLQREGGLKDLCVRIVGAITKRDERAAKVLKHIEDAKPELIQTSPNGKTLIGGLTLAQAVEKACVQSGKNSIANFFAEVYQDCPGANALIRAKLRDDSVSIRTLAVEAHQKARIERFAKIVSAAKINTPPRRVRKTARKD